MMLQQRKRHASINWGDLRQLYLELEGYVGFVWGDDVGFQWFVWGTDWVTASTCLALTR